MYRATARRTPGLPEGTYVELVRSVLATLLPTTLMGILFVVVAAFATRQVNDPALLALWAAGTLFSLVRVGTLLWYERAGEKFCADRSSAALTERCFGVTYLAFAFVLGLFGARVFQVGSLEVQLVTVALLVGYAAGVAAGVSLRPWIAIPSVVLAIGPAVGHTIAGGDPAHRLLGLVMAAFLAGGVSSIMARFRSASEKITMRRAFGELARRDPLTGLVNRLGLADAFRQTVSTSPHFQAVHYLDLDRFKAVNDQFGHPTGDVLLKAVAMRLDKLLRVGDVAARLGGDEFVVLQSGMSHADEAELLARRIARAIGETYSINGHVVSIGVSIGFVVSTDCDDALDDLLAKADQASYSAKKRGGGVALHEPALGYVG